MCEQNRKVIVKSFKPYVKKICMEDNGHMVMMGVFDTVDDTVLVRRTILSVSGVQSSKTWSKRVAVSRTYHVPYYRSCRFSPLSCD